MKGYIDKGTRGRKKYQAWIDRNTSADPTKVRGSCRIKAEAMASVFPELRVVGAVYMFSHHAWCVDNKGCVVDPTAHQFNSGKYSYKRNNPLELSDFPIRKCHMCGELVWPDTDGVRAFMGVHEGRDLEDEGIILGPHTSCDEMFMKEMEEYS